VLQLSLSSICTKILPIPLYSTYPIFNYLGKGERLSPPPLYWEINKLLVFLKLLVYPSTTATSTQKKEEEKRRMILIIVTQNFLESAYNFDN
jgi:hypothetical protein